MSLKYRSLRRYKYQVTETFKLEIGEVPLDREISNKWVKLSEEGLLTVRKGYVWDGPSGPTFDSASAMRASLVHDALYQFLREGLIDPSFRTVADNLLRDLAIEDGMALWRAKLWRWAVRRFASTSARGE